MTETRPTVLITGAAGNLGAAVVAHFAGQGARLLLADRNAGALRQHYGGIADAELVEVNLLDREQVADRIGQAITRAGRVDVLCHLAGGFHMGERVHDTPAAAWDLMMDLNARSLIHAAAAVVPRMIAQGAGRIVAVGAAGALKGGADMGAYAASKSALMRLVESMSAELRDRPELFCISALSSISITTVRISPRLPARRSATSEFCAVVHSDAALSGRLGNSSMP